MRDSLFRKTLRDQRWALLGWGIGLALLALYLGWIYPFVNRAAEMMKVLETLPPGVDLGPLIREHLTAPAKGSAQ